MPGHMSRAVTAVPPGTVCAAWIWSVIHKNAPGAIRAMAFTVTPVRPRVGRIPVDGAVLSETATSSRSPLRTRAVCTGYGVSCGRGKSRPARNACEPLVHYAQTLVHEKQVSGL